MGIKYIDIVHHTHTDFGYTDHPLKSRALLKSYVGQAVDYVLDSQNSAHPFAWTCETILPVWDWWQCADAAQKERLTAALQTGNLDIMGLPFNITAFLGEQEWDHMMKWIPDPLWEEWNIRTAMQNDVNGLHTGGMCRLMDKGIDSLWIGPNTYNALPPMPTPHAFNWRMPDGRKLFVWLNASYGDGFFLFHKNWRQGPVPNSNNLMYRCPGEEDIFRSDKASLEEAHRLCRQNIALIQGDASVNEQLARDGFTQNKIYGNYPYETLCVSVTNQWRYDNDPPIPHLRRFVERWNKEQLQPALRLVTATRAMQHIREEVGVQLPEYSGEWPDWWANGNAATPFEMSVSRAAKRTLVSADSPVLSGRAAGDGELHEEALYNLCMFDEHTYGSWAAVSQPYSYETRAAKAEKDVFAYRALDAAQGLLTSRARESVRHDGQGIYVINTAAVDYCGFIELPANCIRGRYDYVENSETGEIIPLEYISGAGNFTRPRSQEDLNDEDASQTFTSSLKEQGARFWVNLPANAAHRFLPKSGQVRFSSEPAAYAPQIETDGQGWPTAVRYENGESVLLDGEAGDFFSITCEEFAPRWVFKDIFQEEKKEKRAQMAEQWLKQVNAAQFTQTARVETDYETTFTQTFTHPSLSWAKRIFTISKQQKRAKLTIRFNRKSNLQPEIYYVALQLTDRPLPPKISNVGRFFTPGDDQIPGSCMDYYAIDGTVVYEAEGEKWIVGSRDAALVSFGRPNVSQRIDEPDDAGNRMLFMLFNNTWDTNFAADAIGVMEFSFDLLCGQNDESAAVQAALQPVVIVNMR